MVKSTGKCRKNKIAYFEKLLNNFIAIWYGKIMVIVQTKKNNYVLLARLYKSTDRAIALFTVSALALPSHKMFSFWLKFLKADISWTSGWI